MHDYWLYVCKHGRLIGPPVAIPATNDRIAIEFSKSRLYGLDAELRDGERLVKGLLNIVAR